MELKAEVDVRNTENAKRRLTDLVEAIKRNRDADVFVVVGVPGAGKSVALRKCCVDLLETQRVNERIPIYVNLKEWTSSRRWSADAPPTSSEFSEFVSRNIRDRLPDGQRAFFNEHFDRLVSVGEIFFMFDSFDEIPGLLDVDETSKLLAIVSDVVVRYLRGASRGRGVIASRHYRRPNMGQERHVQLDVRPFTDRQIAQAVSKSAVEADRLLNLLQKERPELGLLARNPFTLSLILLFWEKHKVAPDNQSHLFSDYIDESLEEAEHDFPNFAKSKLRSFMSELSWAMFETDNRGLEISARELRTAFSRDDVDGLIDALVAARLVRKAPRTQSVSFVHRRFNEFFLVSKWLSGEKEVPFRAIPTDSRYRDALVLYAEVAKDEDAARLAQFCWEEVKTFAGQAVSKEPLRGVYCLRFLTEAFRVRQAPLSSFQDDLGAAVIEIVQRSKDILIRKIAVETVGILRPAAAETVLLRALVIDNAWITDAAFSACRYLPEVAPPVEDALFRLIARRPQIWIIAPDREFIFALGASDAFLRLRSRLAMYRLDMIAGVIVGILFVFVQYFYSHSM